MLSHAQLKAKMLKNPKVKTAYKRLAIEMRQLDKLLLRKSRKP
ncbi:MAG: hypothetical protein RL368_957 [Pseudomonadota bacterium]|jgi:hypothetical protein